MRMSKGMVYRETVARLVGRVVSNRDRRREEPKISLDRLERGSRIKPASEL
jgi:hypothetical protein